MSFVTTATKLKTILDTISANILPVKYQFQETKPTSFPAGMILFAGGSERLVDSQTNETTERFIIRTIYPTEEGASAQTKWATLLDALGAEFRKDDHQTLTGSVISFLIKEYSPINATTESIQPVVVFDILVEAKTLNLINT